MRLSGGLQSTSRRFVQSSTPRWKDAALGALFIVWLLAAPAGALAQLRLYWSTSPSNCDNGYANCSNPLLLDGQRIGSTTGSGSVSFGNLADGETHVLSLTSTWCSSIADDLDDFGTINVYEENCEESCATNKLASFSLGDNCGSGARADFEVTGCGGCDAETAAPVSFASGRMKTIPQTDFEIADPFFPVQLVRTYSSSPPYDGVLGWGWRHNFDVKLYQISTQSPPYFKVTGLASSLLIPAYATLVDNDSAGGPYETSAVMTGSWVASTSPTGFIGPNYVHDNNSDKGSKSARFTPVLAYAGDYQVSVRYTSHANRASNVPIVIHSAKGETTQTVDMRSGGGTWVSLGTHRFHAGESGHVEIQTRHADGTDTDGYVIADAVWFSYQQNRSFDGSALLSQDPQSGAYRLELAEGTVYHFRAASPYLLTRMQNADGHELHFGYDSNDLLQTITTPAGRIISFSYVQSGGKPRVSSVSTDGQTLVDYTYSAVSDPEGIAGRLKLASYPEDNSGYEYTYSSVGGLYRFLERVADLGGRVLEEHTWGLTPSFPYRVAVLSSRSAGEYVDLSYTGAGDTKKTTVTRRIDAQTSESYEVTFDKQGRVKKKSGGCSGCGSEAQRDRAGNRWLLTDVDGRHTLSRFDGFGNRLSTAEVTITPDQEISASDDFEGPSVDPTKWQTDVMLGSFSNRTISTIEQRDGVLHLQYRAGATKRTAGVISKFRMQGDFDISLRYSGMVGAAQNNQFLFGVTSHASNPWAADAFTAYCDHDENDGFRATSKPAGGGWTYGSNSGNIWSRRNVLRVVRSGNNFTLYRNGTVSMGTRTLSMPNEVYVFALVNTWVNNGPALTIDVEDFTVNSGTAIGDLYTEVAGTRRTWEHKNPLLPRAVTRTTEPSAYAGLEKSTVYDYDDPDTDPDLSTPNSHPTRKLYRLIEQGYSNTQFDGAPELVERITQYSYYGESEPGGLAGQLKSVDGPLANDTITYIYDSVGQLESVTNGLGQTVQYGAYGAYGRAAQITDANGVQTSLVYSRRGQALSRTFDPAGLNLTSTNLYADDLLLRSTSPKGAVTANTYDGYRRLESTARRASATGPDLEKAIYGLNHEGARVLEELEDVFGAVHYTVSTSHGKSLDPSDGVTTRDFIKVEAPTGSGDFTTTWSDESGRPVTRQDPSGHLTLYAYDGRGRLGSVTEKDVSDGGSGLVDHVTSYAYDLAGNLISVNDPQGLITLYHYDDFGRLLEVDSPDSGVTRYFYDSAGRLTSKMQAVASPDVTTSAYAYDDLGRLLGVAYETSGRDVDYYYDGRDQGSNTSIPCNGYSVPIPQSFAEGRLSAVALILDPQTDEKVVTTYEYDKRGLLLYERKYVGSSTPHVTAYTYDADGSVESITYSRGLEVQYVYGGSDPGRVTAVQADQGSGAFDIASSVEYRPFGDVSGLSYANGHSLDMAHDQAYRLLGLEVPGVLFRSYGRDSRGNITSVGFSGSTTDKTFAYDEVSRLTAAAGPWGSYGWKFDKNGNRTEASEGTTRTYQYWTGTNRVSGFDGNPASLGYNGLGNLIESDTDELAYGPDDRLLQMGPAGTPDAAFLHLADGRRLQKLPTTADPVVYHHDLAGNLLSETHVADPSGTENPSVEYVYLGQHRLAAVVSQGAAGGYLPTFAAGPGASSGPWYARLVVPGGARSLVLGLMGLAGVSLALVRRRPRWAMAAGALALSGGAAALWVYSTRPAHAITPPANVYFFHNGHLGEPLALTDYQGNVVWETEYKPYGQLIGETGSVTIGDPQTTGIVWKPPFRFPGQLEDTETGLFYNHNRYYQPGLGNYTRPDPIGIPRLSVVNDYHVDTPIFLQVDPAFAVMNPDVFLGVIPIEKNIYRYAFGNPTNWSDPLGLWPEWLDELRGAVSDFKGNYRRMRERNLIGVDKYYHCMANCQAAQRGHIGRLTAISISYWREVTDRVRGDSAEDCLEDMKANMLGLSFGTKCPTTDCKCSRICHSLWPY
jgi:RHS repeat-associated protein